MATDRAVSDPLPVSAVRELVAALVHQKYGGREVMLTTEVLERFHEECRVELGSAGFTWAHQERILAPRARPEGGRVSEGQRTTQGALPPASEKDSLQRAINRLTMQLGDSERKKGAVVRQYHLLVDRVSEALVAAGHAGPLLVEDVEEFIVSTIRKLAAAAPRAS